MGMGQQNKRDSGRIKFEFIKISGIKKFFALKNAAVNDEIGFIGLDQGTGAGYFLGRAVEWDLHYYLFNFYSYILTVFGGIDHSKAFSC